MTEPTKENAAGFAQTAIKGLEAEVERLQGELRDLRISYRAALREAEPTKETKGFQVGVDQAQAEAFAEMQQKAFRCEAAEAQVERLQGELADCRQAHDDYWEQAEALNARYREVFEQMDRLRNVLTEAEKREGLAAGLYIAYEDGEWEVEWTPLDPKRNVTFRRDTFLEAVEHLIEHEREALAPDASKEKPTAEEWLRTPDGQAAIQGAVDELDAEAPAGEEKEE